MKIQLLENGQMPVRATPGSAGLDLRSVTQAYLGPGQRKLVSCGVRVRIPLNCVGLVCPRSGLAAKHGVTVLNAPGIIDSDYRGEVHALLFNSTANMVKIEAGDRIAQLVIVPYLTPTLEQVSTEEEFLHEDPFVDNQRGTKGFGHSGMK